MSYPTLLQDVYYKNFHGLAGAFFCLKTGVNMYNYAGMYA